MALTQAQWEMHQQGIGGSEAAAAVGLSKWQSPLELYLDKVEPKDQPDEAPSEAAHFGTVLESVVADEYSRRTGNKVRRKSAAAVAVNHAFMFAHLDREVLKQPERTILECKTAGQYMDSEWGEDWSDEYPDHYRIQVHHQMICANAKRAHLAVLIGGRDFRIYDVERDEELCEALIQREGEFWQRVIDRDPPSPRSLSDMLLLWPQDMVPQALVDDEHRAKVLELAKIKAVAKELKTQSDELADDIRRYMEDASLLVDEEGTVLASWKKSKDSQTFNQTRLKEELPMIWQEYMEPKKGSRKFILKVKHNQEAI